MIATSAPASKASIAARMPAQPAPTTRTSCSPITTPDASATRPGSALEPGPCHGQNGVSELLEVVPEHARQLARTAVVGVRIAPRRARIEQPRVDLRHLHRDTEAEDGIGPVVDLVEVAGECGMKEAAGRRDRHPLPDAEGAAGPPGVDEPDRGVVLLELAAEHLGVHRRRLREERRSEAGR